MRKSWEVLKQSGTKHVIRYKIEKNWIVLFRVFNYLPNVNENTYRWDEMTSISAALSIPNDKSVIKRVDKEDKASDNEEPLGPKF